MDTLNDLMSDLLIEQDGRLKEQATGSGKTFAIRAGEAQKIIDGEAEGHANQN